jgi:hypothetical protein
VVCILTHLKIAANAALRSLDVLATVTRMHRLRTHYTPTLTVLALCNLFTCSLTVFVTKVWEYLDRGPDAVVMSVLPGTAMHLLLESYIAICQKVTHYYVHSAMFIIMVCCAMVVCDAFCLALLH